MSDRIMICAPDFAIRIQPDDASLADYEPLSAPRLLDANLDFHALATVVARVRAILRRDADPLDDANNRRLLDAIHLAVQEFDAHQVARGAELIEAQPSK